jgi:carboxylesterase
MESYRLSDEALALWEQHVTASTTGVQLQPECEPRRFSPPSSVPFKGVAVLFHGFTACPQQFYEMSENLTRAGFEVLLPLMPGQGRMPRVEDGKKRDDISGLPTPDERYKYVELAMMMTDIVRKTPGLKVVGGLSVGGMVANAALIEGQDVWDRGVLLAPFYSPPGFARYAAAGASWFLPTYVHSWGKECEEAQLKPGTRAGICQFQFQQMQATATLGKEILAKSNAVRVPVQLVGVEADPTADVGMAVDAFRKMPKGDACFYAKGVPHSLISRKDHLDMDMDWVSSLNQQMAAFALNGTPFATGETSAEHGYPLCQRQVEAPR